MKLPMPMCEFAVGEIVICFEALPLQWRYVHDRVSWYPKSTTAWKVAQQHVLAETKRNTESL